MGEDMHVWGYGVHGKQLCFTHNFCYKSNLLLKKYKILKKSMSTIKNAVDNTKDKN